MKKILLFCGVLAATVLSSLGQGTVTFNNNASTLLLLNGSAAPVGSLTVGLYWAPTLGDSLTQIATTGVAAPGRFIGGNVTTPAGTPGGGTAAFQVRAWQSQFSTYDLALAGGGMAGLTDPWTQVTGNANPTDLPKPITPPSGGFTGLNVVPEPSSIALGVLGLGAIALFRRRK